MQTENYINFIENEHLTHVLLSFASKMSNVRVSTTVLKPKYAMHCEHCDDVFSSELETSSSWNRKNERQVGLKLEFHQNEASKEVYRPESDIARARERSCSVVTTRVCSTCTAGGAFIYVNFARLTCGQINCIKIIPSSRYGLIKCLQPNGLIAWFLVSLRT